MSMAAAMSCLQWLLERGVLCQSCGYRIGEHTTQFHQHCTKCKHPNVVYNAKKVTDFEWLLCKRLEKWVSEFLVSEGPKDGQVVGTATDSQSN